MEIALKETQTRFYALDLKNAGEDFSIDDGFNLLKLHVKEAEKTVRCVILLLLMILMTRSSGTDFIRVGVR